MLLRSRAAADASRRCGTCQHRAPHNISFAYSLRAVTPAACTPAIAAGAPGGVQRYHRDRRAAVVAAAKQSPAPDEFNDEYEEFEDEADFADAAAADVEDAAAVEDEELYSSSEQMPETSLDQLDSAAAAAEAADQHKEDEGEDDFEEAEMPFPEPEDRATLLSDLLGLAAEAETAAMLQQDFPDVFVTGITDRADNVLPGDLYCCTKRLQAWGFTDGHDPESIAAALEAGAVAVLAQAEYKGLLADLVPDDVPVLYTDDTDELSARLAAVYYDIPSASLSTIAVTGSAGKTTVSWLVRGLLEQAGQLTGMIGSIEHALAEHLMTPEGTLWTADEADPAADRECSSPFSLVPYQGRYLVEETTPNPLQMQRLLAAMHDRGATAAVVECSAKGIATGSTDWLSPDIVVFTNSGDNPAELELFDSKEECLEAWLELFQGLKDPSSQRAVVNLDDPAARAVLQACSAVPSVTYSMSNPSAAVYVESLELTLWQTTMIVVTPNGRLEIITNLIGRHNVYNVLAAVAVGMLLGLPLADIGAGIESVQLVPGRCEVVNNILELGDTEEDAEQLLAKLPHDFPVVVDAADTPQRLATVLEAIREAGAKRVFTVFGCDGMVTSGETRARMGEVAHQRSEFVILTNASPALESPADIMKDIISGWPNDMFEPYAAYVYNVFQDQTRAPVWFEPFLQSAQRRWHRHIMEDRFQAIRAAIGTASAGDVVLLAGRGHKDWVDHADGEGGIIRGWFDDRVEARDALSKLEYLYALTGLDRSALPWGPAPDEGKTVVVELDP